MQKKKHIDPNQEKFKAMVRKEMLPFFLLSMALVLGVKFREEIASLIPTSALPFTEAEEKRIGRRLGGILTLKYQSKTLRKDLLDYYVVEETYSQVVDFCKENGLLSKSFSSDKVVYFRELDYKLYILPNGSLFVSE